MKLNIGCGEDYREGYVNIDMREDVRTDRCMVIMPSELKAEFAGACVEHIVMHDVLEHFGRYEGIDMLKACYDILDDEGEMSLQLPDVASLIKLDCSENQMISHIFGRQHRPGDAHKWGYTPTTIHDLLYDLFFFVTSMQSNGVTMRMTVIKAAKIRLLMDREGIECVK